MHRLYYVFCVRGDISAARTPIGVKVCMMVDLHICPGPIFSLLGAVPQRILKIQNFGPLKSEYIAALHVK